MNQVMVRIMKQCVPVKGRGGFTLVESMVALVVLSIGVIGTIAMCEWAQRGAAARGVDDDGAGDGGVAGGAEAQLTVGTVVDG
jgi:prepilin-type N-terminal cleavage/methylation domain-containing protein